jgi:hypothetical protein
MLFCSEDRALLCRQCDLMVHTANKFTAEHHRYLFSGIAAGAHAVLDRLGAPTRSRL